MNNALREAAKRLLDQERAWLEENPDPDAHCDWEIRVSPDVVGDAERLARAYMELADAIDTLSKRCGFPIVEDRVQVLGTIGNKVERQSRRIEELRAENAFLKSFLQMHSPKMNGQHSYRWQRDYRMELFRGPDVDSAVKAAMEGEDAD